MQLKLKHAIIRALTEADASSIQRYANNRNIWLNVRDIFPHPYALEHAQGFIKFLSTQNPLTNFAIATEAEAIGCIGLRLGEDVHRKTAELGYWLGEPFWRRGIATEAVTALATWAFANLDLQRIYAEPFITNDASARVLEKAGFTLEARLRNNVFKDGKILDSLLYARYRA